MKKIIIFVISLLVAHTALAGGYRVSMQGQKALGMGHTGVGLAESAETVFFNPAGMTQLQHDHEISGSVNLLNSTIKYQNTTTQTAAETDSPIATPLSFYSANHYNDKISYGIGLYTGYGSTVEWPTDWVGSHLINNISLQAVHIQPTLAYKVNDQLSVGGGVSMVNAALELNRNLTTSLADGDGNRTNVTLKGSGITAWGYNLAAQYRMSNALTLGASYQAEVTLKAENKSATFSNVPTSAQAIYTDTTFDAELVLPAELTLGLAYQYSSDTTIAFDINHTQWSAYKALTIEFANAVGTTTSERNYVDTNIYRLGVQHQINDELVGRAGIYLDESPVPVDYVTPDAARNDAMGYTAGLSYTLKPNLVIDGSLLIIRHSEFDGAFTPESFSGTWKPSAYSVGLGVSYVF